MQYSDIINNGTLVYKSLLKDSKLREWPVKETSCTVRFYKTEDLSELELVLLRLISSLESNKITKEDIALTLGFDVAEKTFGDKRFYRDQAEVSLFNSMIDSIFKGISLLKSLIVLINVLKKTQTLRNQKKIMRKLL